jgi:hypothetical protein
LVSEEIDFLWSSLPAALLGNSIFTRNVPASFPLAVAVAVAVAAVKRNLRQKKLPRKNLLPRRNRQQKRRAPAKRAAVDRAERRLLLKKLQRKKAPARKSPAGKRDSTEKSLSMEKGRASGLFDFCVAALDLESADGVCQDSTSVNNQSRCLGSEDGLQKAQARR